MRITLLYVLRKRTAIRALAGWLRWVEHCPVHQKFAASIAGQGAHLGFISGMQGWFTIWKLISIIHRINKRKCIWLVQ